MPGQEPASRCSCNFAEIQLYIFNSEVSVSIPLSFSIPVLLASIFPPMFKRYASNSGPRVRTPLRSSCVKGEHKLEKNLKAQGGHSAFKSQEDAEKVRDKYVANVLAVVQWTVLQFSDSKISRNWKSKQVLHLIGSEPFRYLHAWNDMPTDRLLLSRRIGEFFAIGEIRWATAVVIKIRLTRHKLFKSSSFE